MSNIIGIRQPKPQSLGERSAAIGNGAAGKGQISVDSKLFSQYKVGDTLTAQVMPGKAEGEPTKLLLSNGAVIETNAQLPEGDTIKLIIASKSDARVVLTAVQDETSGTGASKTPEGALVRAGAEVNRLSVEIASELVNRGIPVDANSVSRITDTLTRFPALTVEQAVFLFANHIEANTETVTALANLLRGDTQIGTMLDGLTRMLASESPQSLAALYYALTSPLESEGFSAVIGQATINTAEGKPGNTVSTPAAGSLPEASVGEAANRSVNVRMPDINVVDVFSRIAAGGGKDALALLSPRSQEIISRATVTAASFPAEAEQEIFASSINRLGERLTPDIKLALLSAMSAETRNIRENIQPGTAANVQPEMSPDTSSNAPHSAQSAASDNSPRNISTNVSPGITDSGEIGTRVQSPPVIQVTLPEQATQPTSVTQTMQGPPDNPNIPEAAGQTGAVRDSATERIIPAQQTDSAPLQQGQSTQSAQPTQVGQSVQVAQVEQSVVQATQAEQSVQPRQAAVPESIAQLAAAPENLLELTERGIRGLTAHIERDAEAGGEAVHKAVRELTPRLEAMRESAGAIATEGLVRQLEQIVTQVKLTQDINQFMYMQVPFTMGEKEKTAELYIMKRGARKLDEENANILLALDMENMGRVETLIQINRKDVRLRMRVDDESAVPLLKDSTVDLHERLRNTGYNLSDMQVMPIRTAITPLNVEEVLRDEFMLNDAARVYRGTLDVSV